MSLQRNPSGWNVIEEQNAIQEAVEEGVLVDSHCQQPQPQHSVPECVHLLSAEREARLSRARLGLQHLQLHLQLRENTGPRVSRCRGLCRPTDSTEPRTLPGPRGPKSTIQRFPRPNPLLLLGNIGRGAVFLGIPAA